MDPNNDPLFNPTWNMNMSTYSHGQPQRAATLPTNMNNMPSLEEIQHNLMHEELEAVQQDP